MDNLLLITGAVPLASFALAFYARLFNRGLKEEIEALTAERNRLKAKQEWFDTRLQEKERKLAKALSQVNAYEKELEELKSQVKLSKSELRKVKQVEEEARLKEAALERKVASTESLLRKLQDELLQVKQREAQQAEELRKVREENRRLKESLAAASARGETTPPVRVEQDSERDRAEASRQRAAIAAMKRALAEKEVLIRTLKRKLEHNRRAYLVTMLQLDLAQDELCLLKYGHVRRETALARLQVPRLEDAEDASAAKDVMDDDSQNAAEEWEEPQDSDPSSKE